LKTFSRGETSRLLLIREEKGRREGMDGKGREKWEGGANKGFLPLGEWRERIKGER